MISIKQLIGSLASRLVSHSTHQPFALHAPACAQANTTELVRKEWALETQVESRGANFSEPWQRGIDRFGHRLHRKLMFVFHPDDPDDANSGI